MAFIFWCIVIVGIILIVGWYVVLPIGSVVFMIHALRKEKKDRKEHPERYRCPCERCKSSNDGIFMSGDDIWP